MTDKKRGNQKGSLCDPNRHNIAWQSDDYYDTESLYKEMDRVFDICLGCRRCVTLCKAFPTLFDLVDESDTGDLEPEIHRPQYHKVVEQCYLCDRCYVNKCPYTPPHEWEVDFPHIMLQAKAQNFKQDKVKRRDKWISSTNKVAKLVSIPVVATVVNKANNNHTVRRLMDKLVGISADAPLPRYHSKTFQKIEKTHKPNVAPIATPHSTGRVILFTTCYGNYNMPQLCEDLEAVFEHNEITVLTPKKQSCCGMPKLELGDLKKVDKFKRKNIPMLYDYVMQGYDIVAPIPSCVLMFKQEFPLMYPDDEKVLAVRNAFYDPFEYLLLRHKDQLMKTDFKHGLGKISYHVACHLEVQNMGLKTEKLLQMIPDTEITTLQRCSGHDGTYAVKTEFRENSVKIAKPVMRWIEDNEAVIYSSDCPMATEQIASRVGQHKQPVHPITLLRKAYGV